MKILVIGNSRETARVMAGMRAGEPGEITSALVHFADAEQALHELHRDGDDYGWVLIEGGSDSVETAAAVRACRTGLPVMAFRPLAEAGPPARGRPSLCAVETTCDGMQILRCALQRASLDDKSRDALHAAIDSEPLVFEYHAPCRKSS